MIRILEGLIKGDGGIGLFQRLHRIPTHADGPRPAFIHRNPGLFCPDVENPNAAGVCIIKMFAYYES
jgi:hypothetical protein